jgi:hypothetical protein
MSIVATVENDSIKLPAGVHLPNGTKVSIETLNAHSEASSEQSFAERYAKYVGVVKDAPSDLAKNHDAYLRAAILKKK